MLKIFDTITSSPLSVGSLEITLLLTITLAQNDCHTKNYIVFVFYQVTFTNCKQPPCQVLLTKDSSDFDFKGTY